MRLGLSSRSSARSVTTSSVRTAARSLRRDLTRLRPAALGAVLNRTALVCTAIFSTVLLAGCAATKEEDRLLREIRESTIVPQLGSYDEEEQREATMKVREGLDRAPESTAEILAVTLEDPVAEDRTKIICAHLLSTVQDPRAIPLLLEHIGTTNEAAQDLVRSSLQNYGSTVVPQIIEVLDTGDDVARSSAANLLIDLRAPEGYDAFWKRLPNEKNSEVRFLLVCGIAHDPRDVAGDRLLKCLEDKDELIREFAWTAAQDRLSLPEGLEFNPAAEREERLRQLSSIDHWLHSR